MDFYLKLYRIIMTPIAFINEFRRWRKMRSRAWRACAFIMAMEVEYASMDEILCKISKHPAIPAEFWGPIALNLQVRCGRGWASLDDVVLKIGRYFR